MADPFHPDLRAMPFLPRAAVGPWSLRAMRWVMARMGGSPRGVQVVAVDADVSVRVFRPASAPAATGAYLWMHGGGMVMGSAAQDDATCRHMADTLGLVVASVEYRLAPEHPFPTPLEDCYTALRWLAAQPGIDPERIAIGGASAGGGLAAGLALLARERAQLRPALQVLLYPMLDDRTTQRTDVDEGPLRLWNPAANRFGWGAYLGPAAGGEVSPLAAPARCDDLSGLPPAWIGVGTHDLFFDEDVAYAAKLREARVAVDLLEVPGAYHGFDAVEPTAAVSRAFMQAQIDALRRIC